MDEIRETKPVFMDGESINNVLEFVSNGVAIYEYIDGNLELVYCNRTLCRMLGYSEKVFRKKYAKNALFFFGEDQKKEVRKFFENCIRLGMPVEEVLKFTRSDGNLSWIKIAGKPIPCDACDGRVAVTFTDVTDEIMTKEEIRFRADHDPLTGIYNASAFYKHTRDMLSESTDEFVLVRLNIVKFKVVNEIFGEKIADDILVALAEKLKRSLEGVYCSYGRLTSDHFALCLYAELFDEDRLRALIGDIRESFPDYYNINVKAGVYRVSDKAVSVPVMCDRAKLALQTIKDDNAQSIAYYNDEIRKALLAEQRIENEMQWALDTEQFEVWFQPIYSLSSMQPYSAEALVRWRHPSKGLISPGTFIPIFEKNGFISKLDHYIFDHVCAYIRHRIDNGFKQIPISVNVSRMSLYKEDLADDIIELVERYKLSPELFKIEITETAYSNNPTTITNTVNRLRSYGFTILMDDFGSGYSSLNILKDLPIDVLKIDMSFMADLNSTDKAANILTSIVRMAKWLDMPCIAEGVETRAQVNFLKSIGCDNIQGFYFSKPLPREDFEKVVSSDIEEVISDKEPNDSISRDVDEMLSGNETVTKLMNGMFGAMGFYEFDNGKLEVIRVNEGYYKMFGYSLSDFSKDAKDVFQKVYKQDLPDVIAACQETISTRKTVHKTFRRLNPKGDIFYLRASFNSFGGTRERPLLCIAFNDITAHKLLEKKTREKMSLLNELSKKLLERTDIDATINEILAMVRNYYKADRASIFEFDNEKGVSANTYEQCAENIPGHSELRNPVPTSSIKPWIDFITKHKAVSIIDISQNTELKRCCRDWYAEMGIESTVATAVMSGEKLTGCICIDNPKTNIEQVDFLQSFGYYFSLEMMKYKLQKKSEAQSKRLNAIMENMHGGVGLFSFGKEDISISFGTDKFYKILGIEKDYKGGFSSLVNYLDREDFRRNIFDATESGSRIDVQFRAANPCENGEEKWISFSGSTMYNPETNEPMGIAVINDVTDKIYAEQGKYSSALTSVYDRIYRVDMVNSDIELISEKANSGGIIHPLLNVFSDENAGEKRKWLAKICKDAYIKGSVSRDSGFTSALDGKYYWYTCTAIRFTDTVFLICILNTTVTKNAQQLEIENQKLRLKEHFQETSNIYVRQTGIVLIEYNYESRTLESTDNFDRFMLSEIDCDGFCSGSESFRNAVHPDDYESARDLILSAENRSVEARFLTKDGEYIWCQVLKTISYDKQGKPLYANYTMLDIDDRRKSEEKATNALEMIENVINSAHSGIAFVEVSKDYRIIPLLRNETYYKLLGREEEECVKNGYTICDLVSETYRDEFKERIVRSAYIGETFSEEIKIHRGDTGERRWIRCEFAPYTSRHDEDDKHKTIVILTDITELKMQTLKLDAVINSLPGGVAHYRVVDDKFKSEFYSRSIPELWGYGNNLDEYEAIVKDDARALIHEEDRARVYATAKYLITTGTNVRLSFRIKCRIGYRWVTLSASKLADHSDGTSSISCLYTISSERELMYRRMLDEASIGIYVCDEKSKRTLYINNTLRDIMDIDEEADIGTINCFSLLSDGDESFADDYVYDSYCSREVRLKNNSRLYIRGRRIRWNGIPAVIEYVSER